MNKVVSAVGTPTVDDNPRPMTCLLHGEFHVMSTDCWNKTLEFWFEWEGVDTPSELKNRYDQEVERKMLNDLIERLQDGRVS